MMIQLQLQPIPYVGNCKTSQWLLCPHLKRRKCLNLTKILLLLPVPNPLMSTVAIWVQL